MKTNSKAIIIKYQDREYQIGLIEYNKNVLFIWDFDTKKYSLDNLGIGTKEYSKIEKFAKTKKIKRIYGDIFSKGNLEAYEYFWKKQGFKLICYGDETWLEHYRFIENNVSEKCFCLNKLIFKEI